MICKRCVNFDGNRCNEILDENDDYFQPPEDLKVCPSFEPAIKKYQINERRNRYARTNDA